MTTSKKTPRARLNLERLEVRVTPDSSLHDGGILITGTNGPDHVRIDRIGEGNGEAIRVWEVENMTFTDYPLSKMTKRVVTFYGWGGDDTFDATGSGIRVIAHGGVGKDTLIGDSQNDYLYGEGDNDTLISEGGDDYCDGGGQNDTVSCGEGSDKARGGNGNDRIDGGSGNDQLDGDSGNDAIGGGAGNDRIDGGSGNDRLDGGLGNDRIDGGAGNDRLRGGAGRDLFFVDARRKGGKWVISDVVLDLTRQDLIRRRYGAMGGGMGG